MSRAIKFRLWDIDNKKYEYDIAIRPINGIIGVEIFNNEMHPVEFRGIVEQYTGLKDKNGKEIYEGDIVKDESDRKGKVYFDEGELAYLFSDPHSWNLWWLRPGLGEYEVIGNVHENPELIGGKE